MGERRHQKPNLVVENQSEEISKVSCKRYINTARLSEVAKLVKFINYSVKESYLWLASSSKTQFLYIHNWRPDLRLV